MSGDLDVVVVGAGIVGASCAWECVQAKLRVLVVDSGPPGSGTTSTNMGQILVEDGSTPEFLLTRMGVRLWRELAPELPADAEFSKLGTIWVAKSEEELAALERRLRGYKRGKVAAKILDPARLTSLEPQLRADLAGGLLVPDDAVVTPASVAEFLLARVVRAGGKLVTGRTVGRIGDRLVQTTDGTRWSCSHVVNAAGVDSPRLSPGVPVKPRKGHIAYTDPHPGFVRHQLIEMGYVARSRDVGRDSISFNVQPRPGGVIRVGSSRQLGIWDRAVDPDVVRAMTDRAREYMPGLERFAIRDTQTGLRPACADGLPLIGPWEAQEGVWLATGHEGLGITMALATGRLLVDQIVGRRSEIPVAPYLPERVRNAEFAAALPEEWRKGES